MKKLTLAFIALVISFAAGVFAGSIYFNNQQMSKQIVGHQQDENDTAINIDLRKHADDAQQIKMGEYQNAKDHDTMRTEALLNRVFNHFDSVQQQSNTAQAEITTPINANTCRIEREEARRLSQQLRSTLERYGREAQRADANTRLLNLCIEDLAAKENLLESYR